MRHFEFFYLFIYGHLPPQAAIGITIGSVLLNRRDMSFLIRFDVIGRQLGRLFDQVKSIEGSVGVVGESVEKSVRGQLDAMEVKVDDVLQHHYDAQVHGVEKHLEL